MNSHGCAPENARLIELLESHGVAWRTADPALPPHAAAQLTTNDKVALFRRLFGGRADVYPFRWESKAGKPGYSPACENEWRPGICEKPRIKCSDCGHRQLKPMTDQTVYDHLAGRHAPERLPGDGLSRSNTFRRQSPEI